MINLFEMLGQAKGSDAMQTMARQFGLTPEQVQSAVVALLPAFQLGMQRQAESAEGLQRMMETMASGGFASFYDGGAPLGQAAEQGRTVLGDLFGSKEISRAIASQASMMSGVSDAVIKQMLPVVAAILMGALSRNAMGGFGGMMPPPAQPQNPMAEMMAIFGGMFDPPKAAPPPPPDAMAAGMEAWKGLVETGQQAQRAQLEAFQSIFQRFAGKP